MILLLPLFLFLQSCENGVDNEVDDEEPYVNWEKGVHNGYEWVNLDLSVKWATSNLGANSPEEYGGYFAWGETTPKLIFSFNDYTYFDAVDVGFLYYNLPKNRDAATVNMGGSWRIPTDNEIKELRAKCGWKWTNDYKGTGAAGYIVTSRSNGNHIFLPAAGCHNGNRWKYIGVFGSYWSSTLRTMSEAYDISFASDYVDEYDSSDRYEGRSVRGVIPRWVYN